ncbi:Rv3235 family protein [Streptomyces sp. AS02]|uniref:Rv3235 family protein n=1 Tax=Streptomyces sp. AS02 TaxID=2938946 RepID=UPI0020218BE5|nr:Rv3235 family protein [Streptomyces sp. AS02]MCL8017759.1 Rv3235 family protein [Streptomyces sp. AS02]
MNKVMTRTQHRPGTRPPTRRDTRRPGSTPPRTPSGGTPRTTSPDSRPPGSSTTPAIHPRTRPADNRPPTAPALGPNSQSTAPSRPRAAAPTSIPTPTGDYSYTPTSETPLPRPAVPHPRPTDVFADRLLLVLSGQRPVHSMLRHTAGRAYDELAWLAERSPLRTRGTRPVVRDIGYFEPRPGALEAFARIGAGDQLRAMAFRLERGGDLRWRCTAVELGGPRRPHTDDD